MSVEESETTKVCSQFAEADCSKYDTERLFNSRKRIAILGVGCAVISGNNYPVKHTAPLTTPPFVEDILKLEPLLEKEPAKPKITRANWRKEMKRKK